jgi:uncharacterized damage-inducible protein DinB
LIVADDAALRPLLQKVLAWEDAHVGFDRAVADIPPNLRGKQPQGLPYSLWQLVEHLRLAQHDILDFSRNANYREMKWPDAYWPSAPEPPSADAWDQSIAAYKADRKALEQMAVDTKLDLAARIPHGSGQTYSRELLLVADHTAYHVGQIVLVRRLLGCWE